MRHAPADRPRPRSTALTTDDLVRRRVIVSGRVQGVWFRESCRREAQAAGVRGWVRNLSDGRVEAELEGDAAAVDRIVGWCRSGPPRAEVIDVQIETLAPAGHRSFTVR